MQALRETIPEWQPDSILQAISDNIRWILIKIQWHISLVADTRVPEQDIPARANEIYKQHYNTSKLSWQRFCTTLVDENGKNLTNIAFFERTGELVIMHAEHSFRKREEKIGFEVIVIDKLLREWFNWNKPRELTIKEGVSDVPRIALLLHHGFYLERIRVHNEPYFKVFVGHAVDEER